MLLRRVELKNFRAFADVTVDLDETTVLIGENNVGKTSFLDAIKLCLTQSPNRRGETFDDYDHHLATDTARVGDAGETSIALHFAETKEDEWTDEIVQTLADVIVVDKNLRKVLLRVRSTRDPKTNEMVPTWEFLDHQGNAQRPRRPVPVILRELQQLAPFFYLSAVRDAAREFQPRSGFWGPFLRNPAIPDAVRAQLEADLATLNEKVIDADARLKEVRDRIKKAGDIVTIGQTNAISIEAVPGRARDLLSRAQIAVSGRSGAKLPMTRHGAGTQSISVLFLFESFLASMLKETYGPDSTPFVALEEPEAHLHPAATRALWKAISGMPGQKVVATHSGDLLARVPLANIRRFCPTPNGLRVRQLGPNTLTADDARKVGLHVRATRGELLFARSWLMVEGETEVWVFEGIAEVLGVDLEREGVRIVQYAQVSPEPYIKLADELGIEWFCLADGDPNGQKYKASAVALLNGRVEGDRVLALPESCIETHLCANGHAAIFEASVASQKASRVQASKGTLDYFEQIVDAQPNRGKPARAIECVESMRKQGAASIPKQLREVIVKVVKLAGGNVAP